MAVRAGFRANHGWRARNFLDRRITGSMPRPHGSAAVLRRFRFRSARALRRALGLRNHAARIARGVSAGCLAGAVPLPVAQIPLSVFLAWAARGNKAFAILPQIVFNAGVTIPLAFVQFKIGAWLWPGRTADAGHAMRALKAIVAEWQLWAVGGSARNLLADLSALGLGILGPMILGVVITGFALALMAYPPAVITVSTWRKWRHSRRLRRGLARLARATPPATARHAGHGTACGRARVAVPGWQARSESLAPALPPAAEPPLARMEILTRYVRFPGRFQRAATVKLLVNGSEAYPEMLAAIHAATGTVDLDTYMIRADHTGTLFQEAMRRAAQRGVRVRLLYDYIGSRGLPDRFVRDLLAGGVEAAVYHPPVFNRPIWVMNRRDHRKILVVDRRILFIGGLNVADDYASVEDGGGGWRDTHLRIDGSDMAEAGERLFDMGWQDATAYGDMTTRSSRLKDRVRTGLRRFVGTMEAPQAADALDAKSGARRRSSYGGQPGISPAGRHWQPGEALAKSGAGPDAGGVAAQIIGNEEFRYRRRIRHAYLYAIRHARRYILIENAYFIPDRGVRRALIRAVQRGVFVAVAVARHNDVAIAALAGRSLYSELLERGVRIFEWPHGMLHAKTAVIDDGWAIVGSYNFDRRSLLHQLEAVAVVADADFAVRLRDQTMADLAQCHEVTLHEHESRSWIHMLQESGAYMLRYWL